MGPKGTKGIRGTQGPTGAQGFKGVKGEEGAVGSRGAKGDTGRMGPPGLKGSTGIKGSKGNRGFTGIQGPKGECVVPPRISVSPESQYVFLNKPATFYCWVQGHLSKKITWRKLGGSFLMTVQLMVFCISRMYKGRTLDHTCAPFSPIMEYSEL